MTTPEFLQRTAWRGPATALIALAGAMTAVTLVACGGGGGGALGNPPQVANAAITNGQKLSFVYFQRCINPIFQAQLQITLNGAVSTNTCSSSGCHDNISGTGGALRLVGGAATVDLANPANTPDVIRASDMFKNFYSAQGATVIGSPAQSRLLNKPLVLGTLHGGGLIFAGEQDANAKLIRYWINHPTPLGQDEFSAAVTGMFTPPDPVEGVCNTD